VDRTPIEIVGAHESPYIHNMRAVLSDRRIPFRWIVRRSRDDVGFPPVPVSLIPARVLPDDDAMLNGVLSGSGCEAIFA
jgi:hypothetical protein